MSLTDPFIIKRWKESEQWYVLRGRETFYNNDDTIILFGDPGAAVTWILQTHMNAPNTITIEVTMPEVESEK